MSGSLSLEAIADLVGGRLVGDGSVVVTGIAPVDEAGPGHLAFLAARRYVRHAATTDGAGFLVSEELESELPSGASAVVVSDAYPSLRTLLQHFFPEPEWTPGVHPTAVLGRGVELGEGVEIGPYAVLQDNVRVGDGCRIGAHCVLGPGTVVGAHTRLHPHVVAYAQTLIGRDVIVHSGARLGVDGFGYTYLDGRHAKMPQVGRCLIEDGVEIGANTTIDRGSLGDTRIGAGVKIDNLVHVAHNVRIGALSLLAALVGIAGSTRIGKGVWLGGQAGVGNQLEIGDGARVAVQSGVMGDVPPGETVSGYPARPHREDLKKHANMRRIPKIITRLRSLEAKVAEFSEGESGTAASSAEDADS
jgi:UDP-3-O-[3-hydroxymyristoyl] glucosamine N-acyltransferase